MRPHDTGDPISLEISSAIPCMSLRMASATLVRMAARSAGAIRGQGPWSKASRAAATARSTSAFWGSGDPPAHSSVGGGRTQGEKKEKGGGPPPPPPDEQTIVRLHGPSLDGNGCAGVDR